MSEAVESRRQALGLSPGRFAEATGLTRQGAANVRSGKRRLYQDDTIHGVARALRWRRDWYERLLAGEEPEEDDHVPSGLLDALDERLARVEEALELISDRLDRALARLDREQT